MENLLMTTPYMLRNDGELLPCGDIHPYILMSVKSSLETNIETLSKHSDFLNWFYENTLQGRVRELINKYKETNDSILLEKLNILTNNEFCRVRTSNYKVPYGGNNGQIYFRISSNNGFNWFDLIYNVVLQYDNLDYVTIMKDPQAFKDVKDFDYYRLKGVEINQLPIEDFLTLEGNPILESLDGFVLTEARRGQTSLKLVMVEVAKKLYPSIDFSRPSDWCIHHVDGDDKNNNMTNISLMPRGKHTSLHSAIKYKKLEKLKDLEKSICYIGRDLVNKTNLEGAESEEKILNDSYVKIREALLNYDKWGVINEGSVMGDKINQNKVKSNGIYSVLNNVWIKNPVQSDIPDIDQEKFDTLFNEWEDNYFELLDSIKYPSKRVDFDHDVQYNIVEENTSMGSKINIEETIMVRDPRDRRKKLKLPEDIENVINSSEFKRIYEVCDRYSVKEGYGRGVDTTYFPDDVCYRFYWTWRHDGAYPNEESITEFYHDLGVDSWETRNGDNQHTFKKLTIEGCSVVIDVTKNFRIFSVSIYDDAVELIESSTGNMLPNIDADSNSDKINDFIEDLYDLRKKSINKDGEYGLGNLVFKEFRNLGYLDNLKELKNKEKSKELSLGGMQ